MKRSPDSDRFAPAFAVFAVAVCCGAPLAAATLLTTGLGATLFTQGWLLAGLALIAVGVVLGVRHLVGARARSSAPSAIVADECRAPTPDVKEDGSA